LRDSKFCGKFYYKKLELILIILLTFFCFYETLDLFIDFNQFIDRFFLEAEDNEFVNEVLGFEKNDVKIIREFVKVCSSVLYYYSLLNLVTYFLSWFGF